MSGRSRRPTPSGSDHLMFQTRRLRMAWVLAALALMPAAALADDPSNAKGAKNAPEPAAADGDLLEYLGSVDSEGQEWMEYLRPNGHSAGCEAEEGASARD